MRQLLLPLFLIGVITLSSCSKRCDNARPDLIFEFGENQGLTWGDNGTVDVSAVVMNLPDQFVGCEDGASGVCIVSVALQHRSDENQPFSEVARHELGVPRLNLGEQFGFVVSFNVQSSGLYRVSGAVDVRQQVDERDETNNSL